MLHDVFICHASADKDDLVAPLAAALVQEHLAVWYDDFELSLGDSLRQAIDRGLAESRFGVVILSPSFFAKNWPQYELDGLLSREMQGNDKVLLPIWHNVSATDVAKYSPPLAGRRAVSTDRGLDEVVAQILRAVRPVGSPLIIARDELLEWGITPPVVTDEFWLDVVEASNRVPAYGAVVPEVSTWGRWSFPLPELDGTAQGRGFRLAWTAMQLRWTVDADEAGVDLSTEPAALHRFIESHHGLLETCRTYPRLVAEYAPQLTISGFGGPLESVFEDEFQKSLTSWGGANGVAEERCAEEWILRHPEFCGNTEYAVAYAYFSAGMFGPEVRLHEHADYLFWLLSPASRWLPDRIHSTVLTGMIRMPRAWIWHGKVLDTPWDSQGELSDAIYASLDAGADDIDMTSEIRTDIHGRALVASRNLNLKVPVADLVTAFIERQVVQQALQFENHRRKERDVPT